MSGDQPGLRLRMLQEARRIVSQHRQLDVFQEKVAQALEQGDPARVLELFTHFREALEAHIRMEEVTHFPALHGLHPNWDAQLTELVREHQTFRTSLAETAESLRRGQLESFKRSYQAFLRTLTAHEAAEEWLFGEVAQEHDAP
ncbi:MAG: hemerythrin domain-containing protein [Deltaproteobacteria bacterium]|nr:hemerythrin domain-containing protein [Deltaproteobacteria bacterium]MBW2419748.1 hemerythrin domain-containing protein [Deltaproteobacteria bacterium]